ncbi:MAG TPA: group 1 truncated hemoglobin [Thermoanaerobaculia bacterium]
MYRRALWGVLGVLFALASASAQQTAQEKKASGPSLYKRLGGYDAIAAVTDEFIVRMAADKQLNRFLVGLSDDSKGRLRQRVVDLSCFATGGPCVYTGRDMKTSHKGMGITESDWNLAVKHLGDALDKFQVPVKEKGEFLAIIAAQKADIVEKQ